jgi:EpsI family protein
MKPIFDNFAEPQTDRRKFVLGLLSASAAGLAAWRSPWKRIDHLGRQKLEDLVPKKIARWDYVANSGLVIPPNDPLLNALYSQQLTRVYFDGENPPIMLLMAQSATQTGFLQVHRPDFCYQAAGYQLSPVRPHPIQLGTKVLAACKMDATNEKGMEQVIFWTRIGNEVPGTWPQQKIAVAEQNLRGIIPDAILVRLSMISDDQRVAETAIDTFVRAMIDAIPADRRSVFVV